MPSKRKPEAPSEDESSRYISLRKKRGRSKPKLQPPLTPMIDVTFQLLLYFLLTGVFREAEGQIPGSLPKHGGVSASPEVKLETIRITLRATGADRKGCKYEMSGENLAITDAEQLYRRLSARKAAIGSDQAPVLIKPMPDVRWMFVVEVFNQAVRARFKNVGFAPTG